MHHEDIMEKRIYCPQEQHNTEEIKQILERRIREELLLLPLSVGEYADKWKTAQNICVKLLEHEDAAVRANAALGLSYIARNHVILDQRIVKPYLLKENVEYRWRIMDAIEDINLFLKWHLVDKALDRIRSGESRGWKQ